MKMVPLGEIATFFSGGTPDRKNPSFYTGDIPWVTGADIGDDRHITPRHYINEKAIQESAARVTQENTLLLVTRTSVGKVAIPPKPVAFSQDITAISPHAGLDIEYLAHFLRSKVRFFALHSRGATIKGVTRNTVTSLEIPLPPLDEQRRIAAILDRADAIRQKRRQLINQIKAITRSAFQQIVAATPPSSRASLATLGVDFVSGKNVVGSTDNSHPANLVLKVNAISSGTFKIEETKPMPADYVPPEKHLVRKGDILFGRASGSIELLGTTAIVTEEVDRIFLPDKIWRLKVNDHSTILPIYVLGVLQSDDFRSYIRHNASGAAGVKNISRSKVLNYTAPVAIAGNQQVFSAAFYRTQSILERMNFSKASEDALFDSLQSRAFKGEL